MTSKEYAHPITIVDTSKAPRTMMHDAARPFVVVIGNSSPFAGRFATREAAQRKVRYIRKHYG